jgi:hypothetical protein
MTGQSTLGNQLAKSKLAHDGDDGDDDDDDDDDDNDDGDDDDGARPMV